MAVIAPNSEIYLIKCPLELDNENQLSFASASAQHTYFNSLPKLSLTNATFQRKDGTIRWPGSMEDILEYNYCMYRNKSHGNKWFYAFVTDVQYVSDSMTAVTIKTDTWQTWQFSLNWKKCFVEREHVNDDTVCTNLVEENLETGDYICEQYSNLVYNALDSGGNASGYYIFMQVTELPNNWTLPAGCGKVIANIPNGLYYIGFDYTQGGLQEVTKVIEYYDSHDKSDAIVSMFIAPETICGVVQEDKPLNPNGTNLVRVLFPEESDTVTIMKSDFQFTPYTDLDGYTPKNKKLYNYPYNYLQISNLNGETQNFKFEDFSKGSDVTKLPAPKFDVVGTLTQSCQIKMICQEYLKSDESSAGWDYFLSGARYPMMSWTSDYYLNWQARNSASMFGNYLAEQTIASVAGGIAGAAMNPLNMVTGGLAAMSAFGEINNAVHQASVAAMQPDQARGNANCGDINFSFGNDIFVLRQMTIRASFARRIDDYFSAYGYKVNEYKIPNRTGRLNWNFVKTAGCNITGDLPQSDIEEIKAMFNNGVTIWHNPTTYLDYSQNNNII